MALTRSSPPTKTCLGRLNGASTARAAAETGSGFGQQPATDAAAPGVGIEIEGQQFPCPGGVGVPARSRGGKAPYDTVLDGHDGRRTIGIGGAKGVAGHAILRPQSIEIGIGNESPVSRLPRPDMDAGHGGGVDWFCFADDEHRIIFDD